MFVCLVVWFLNVLVNYEFISWTGPKTERLTILGAATHESNVMKLNITLFTKERFVPLRNNRTWQSHTKKKTLGDIIGDGPVFNVGICLIPEQLYTDTELCPTLFCLPREQNFCFIFCYTIMSLRKKYPIKNMARNTVEGISDNHNNRILI